MVPPGGQKSKFGRTCRKSGQHGVVAFVSQGCAVLLWQLVAIAGKKGSR